MERRTGESGLLPFRTRRIFNIGADWFFAVRDEKNRGPFENMLDAENELSHFLVKIAPIKIQLG